MWIDEWARLKRLKRMGINPPYELGPREIEIMLYIDTQIDVERNKMDKPTKNK